MSEQKTRAEKRRAFGALMESIERRWNIPDAALQQAADLCGQVMNDPAAGVRDRLRAAENLHAMEERRAARLLAVAQFEEKILETDEQIEKSEAWNAMFPDLATMMKQEQEQNRQARG